MGWFKRYEWWLVGLAACSAFILGYVGIASHYASIGLEVGHMDIVYGVLQLYRVSYPVEVPGSAALVAPNFMLQTARFLAPATVAYSLFRLVGAAIRDAFNRISLSGWEGHAVVCGAGERGTMIVKDLLSRGRKVVVIDPVLHLSHLSEVKAAGARIISESALDETVLKQARVPFAKEVAIATGDDRANFSVASKCAALAQRSRKGGNNPVRIRAHADPSFSEIFEEVPPFGVIDAGADVQFFSSSRLAARQVGTSLISDVALDVATRGESPRINVIGDGRFTVALLNVITRQMQLPGCDGPTIDVASPDLESILEEFPHSHPQLDLVASLNFQGVKSSDLLSGSANLANSLAAGSPDLIFVALQDAFTCIKLGRLMVQEVAEAIESGNAQSPLTQVVVCLEPSTTLDGVEDSLAANQYGRLINITALGASSGSIFNEGLDSEARRSHESYLATYAPQYDPMQPATAPWEILKEEYRDANRRLVDHDKLKRLFFEHDPSTAMVEALAKAEHRSWMADRILAGWRKGRQRDNERKLHPSIVPYKELSESEQRKDIEKVEQAIAELRGV